MSGQRGIYRGVYSSLPDDPDFQRLSPPARHTLLTLRIMDDIGPGCIWRYYLGPIAKRTGYSERVVSRCLDELQAARQQPQDPYGWILRDEVVMWIVNGLRFDPNRRLSDRKHTLSVLNALSGLPKSDIVVKFCFYYKLPRPYDAPSKGQPTPITPAGAVAVAVASGSGSGSGSGVEQAGEVQEGVQGEGQKPGETPEALMALWNEIAVVSRSGGLPGFAECRDLSASRRTKAVLRLKEAELAWHRQAMTRLSKGRFACGGGTPTKDHPKPFRASLDWYLANDTNCLKASEGKYDD